MRLFQADRHEPLSGAPWREDRAREAIARIVADTHQSFSAEGLWPIHPFDRSEERPPDSLDPLLLQAGELVWKAGPPVKFPSLCHGAAGSGYAFLKLYARTGDSQWLERARRFAMHGVDQAARALAQYRPAQVLALDRRPGPGDLSLRLHRRNGAVSDAGRLLIAGGPITASIAPASRPGPAGSCGGRRRGPKYGRRRPACRWPDRPPGRWARPPAA